MPKVQTSRKKFEQKVRAYKNWIYDNRNRPMREIIKKLNVKLIGHYRYYGVTWNFRKITTFLHRVQQISKQLAGACMKLEKKTKVIERNEKLSWARARTRSIG